MDAPPQIMPPVVRTGLDVLVDSDFVQLRGARIGVVANQASVDSQLRHIVDLFLELGNLNVVRLFAPEHGLRGASQDMEEVHSTTDTRSELPVISLYGSSEQSLRPSEEMLHDLDVLVFDLQDVGSRYYTFSQTLAYCMQVCGKCGVRVVVLDRPNPLGGERFEGAMLTALCRSFCGLFPIANRHGLTMGEIAFLIQRGFGEGIDAWPETPCELEVIQMDGWERSMYFYDTCLPWVAPSPNMPTVDTALIYPGTCLLEATNLSEGRGTTKPFEMVGAPFLDGYAWSEAVVELGIGIAGAALRPISFIPKFQKFHGRICSGVQIHVLDLDAFQPFRLGLALIATAAILSPDLFSWRIDAYEFEQNVPAIDLLFGSNKFRKCIETKSGLAEMLEELTEFERWYEGAVASFLLY